MTAWLDRILGRVTMYGLVVICLVAIAAVALVRSALGQLSFSPLALLASGAVLLLSSYLANGVAGLIVNARPQLSSTAITALLLLFIFPPTLDLLGLAALALASVVAVLAKYLLAFRGRHVFNPAALGAFVVGLTGLNFSVWWVATPLLLPVVAIGAFLVLWRTRRFPLALVFLVVATANVVVRSAVHGVPVVDGISTALLSLPLVFFAGFMLDEPLTLPPRRWQQLAEAAIVGVLFYLQFTAGPLTSTPEFALLIGNLLAFFAGQRRGIRLVFLGRSPLTATSWRFDFRPLAPVRFTPGQHMELTLPHAKTDSRGWRRVFSIASAPGDGGTVRFAMRLPERSSSFKAALLALEPGAVVSATSVGGDFVLPKDLGRPLLLVAAGIGITPFVSQLEHAAAVGERRDIVLLYSVSSPDELAFAEVLRAAGCRVIVVSPTPPIELPAGWSWAGAGPVTAAMIHSAVPDAASRTSYLSGPPELVASLAKALRRSGARRTVTDVFIGY